MLFNHNLVACGSFNCWIVVHIHSSVLLGLIRYLGGLVDVFRLRIGEPNQATNYGHKTVVQHLIEICLCFNLSMEECIEALDKHANIMPVITSTVWKELEKENKEFFDAYRKAQEDRILEM
ncbi:hypothetical protein LUZ63_009523 [Rhynchospora breviuscula]|uniref:Uncharacterized protein n=1 Tax=Rhynchospora breviuscula TaxID=2022672 RepID=A0A9Q0CFH5_9POAL|nr:hypothetical protein LUZ63_009523 [Rhynchospora breviuscula]